MSARVIPASQAENGPAASASSSLTSASAIGPPAVTVGAGWGCYRRAALSTRHGQGIRVATDAVADVTRPQSDETVAGRPLAPRIAGILSLLAAVLLIVGVFPTYDSDGDSLVDIPGQAAANVSFTAAIALGLLLCGILLVRSRKPAVGAAGLIVIVATSFNFFWSDIGLVLEPNGLQAHAGLWVTQVGVACMVAAAVLASITTLGSMLDRDSYRLSGNRVLATAAAFTGVASGVGIAMNTFADRAGPFGGLVVPSLPRELWSELLGLIVLSAAPLLVVLTRRRDVAVGLGFGFAITILGYNLGNLLYTYVDDSNVHAIEGTWTFLAASLASLVILAMRSGRRAQRPLRQRARAQPRLHLRTRRLLDSCRPVPRGGRVTLVAAILLLLPIFLATFEFAPNLAGSAPSVAYALVLFQGTFIAGILVLRAAPRWKIGWVALVVIALMTLPDRVLDASFVLEHGGPTPKLGFWFEQGGYVLLLVSILLLLVRRGTDAEAPDTSAPRRWVVATAAFLGFATAVGVAMNFVHIPDGGANGSPFFDLFPRVTWAVVVAVVVLTVVPILAVTARRSAVADGLALGFLVTFIANVSARLLLAYGAFDFGFGGPHPTPIEGEWVYVAAGGAVLFLLAARLTRTSATVVSEAS